MRYGIAQIWELRKEAGGLKPDALLQDTESYKKLRDDVIASFLPCASNTTHTTEMSWYKAALYSNNAYLETILYSDIWDELPPNERLAIEHLHYEYATLVDEESHFYQAMHDYIAAKRAEDKVLARQHLSTALWEVLHNAPYPARNVLERDKAKRRRKAQAAMLNSLNLATHKLPTSNYIVESVRQRYATTPLEDLLPDIVFPLETNARTIAEEIQQINADMQQEIHSLIAETRGEESSAPTQLKSMVSDAITREEATEAFVALTTKIVEGVRPEIEAEIDIQAADGKTSDEIDIRLKEILTRYEDTTIPLKMDMLATHYNGTLTQLQQRELGYSHYIWHSQDDEKVRPDHAANDGMEFSWDDPPPTGHPGEDYNCRCWAEPTRKDGNTESIPLELLIPALALRRIIGEGLKHIIIAAEKVRKNPIMRGEKAPKGGRKDTEWKFDKNKSQVKWKNQKTKRGWTDKEITEAIKNGEAFPAENIRNNNPATLYEYKGKYVVRDDITKEIIQIGGKNFDHPSLP